MKALHVLVKRCMQTLLKSETFKLQYEEAMKSGVIQLQTTNSIVMGVAESGKTHALAMIIDEPLPKTCKSTPLAKEPACAYEDIFGHRSS